MFTEGFEKEAGIFGSAAGALGKTVANVGSTARSSISELRAANQALKPMPTMANLAKQTRATTTAVDLGKMSRIGQMRLANNPL